MAKVKSEHKSNININKNIVRQREIEMKTAQLTGVPRNKVKTVFNTVWDVICGELEAGNSVHLHGKGKFYLSQRVARVGRNPLTGEVYNVPEREAMAFQTSPAYAKRLREKRELLHARKSK